MTENQEPRYQDLEIADNQYVDRDYQINISIPEFNCLCPRTGLPDFATIIINYTPDKSLVELKSLKLYMVKFRSVGIFHEHVTNKILDDFIKASSPRKINIEGRFRPRGGIETVVSTSWEK